MFVGREESNMRMLDNENTTLEEAGFVDEDSILAEIRSRYSLMLVDSRVFHFDQKNMIANLKYH